MALTELIRSQMQHGPFPGTILQGMQSPDGADLQAVQDLDIFMQGFFFVNLPKNFYIQMAVAGSCIAILIIMVSCVILDRLRKRAFWIFKLQRRSEGIYIVPNALNSYLLFEGIFGIIWIAFIVVQYRGYWKRDDRMQYHLGVLSLIIWWPLWIGAFLAGWGSFYTAPGALDKGTLNSSKFGRFAAKPLLINIFCLGTPFILISSLVAPIVLTQRHYNAAFDAYRSLHSDLLASFATNESILSPAVSQGFLDRASSIWDMLARSAWYQSIGYGIWPIWAGLFLLFYIPAGGYLCCMVLLQLQRSKTVLMNLESERREMEVEERYRTPIEDPGAQRGPLEALLFQPLSPNLNPPTRRQRQQQQQETPVDERSRNEGASGEEKGLTAAGSESDQSGGEVFFPALRPELKQIAVKECGVMGTPRLRYQYLRRCFINLTILYLGIVFGAALFLGVASSLAATLYDSYLSDPHRVADLLYKCCLVAAWGAVVFGSLTSFAVLARLADPANTSARVDDSRDKSTAPFRFLSFYHSRSQERQGQTLSDDEQQQQNNRHQSDSRNMPAVPESVGDTMDDQMQSTASFTTFKSSNFLRDLKDSIKFSIQSKQGGGLILRPADNMSFGSVQADFATTSYHKDENRVATDFRGIPMNCPEEMTQGTLLEEEMEMMSGRSYQSGLSAFHLTSLNDVPRPAPPTPSLKPLAPERSPPLSPIHLEDRDHLQHNAPDHRNIPQRRHSVWQMQQQQHHHPSAPRRYSEAGLRKYRSDLGRRVEYPPSPASLLRRDLSPQNSLLQLSSQTTSSIFEYSPSSSSVPMPPSPITASTANFPPTPNNHMRALPEIEHYTYTAASPRRQTIALPILTLEAPPLHKKRQKSLGNVIVQPMGGLQASELSQISPTRQWNAPGFYL
ncbi:hypothetical protein CBS101457_004697 [Exobasidium rhododendri]|nr:hypothetical protein CBS101457_004697 [Exobasidium rhododendri]